MGKSRLSKISLNQFGLMVDFMMLNPEMICGKLTPTFTVEERAKKWAELADLLNSEGLGVKKEPHKWRKTWQDQKCNVKSKALKLKEKITDPCTPFLEQLSDLEIRVLKMQNFEVPIIDRSSNYEGLEITDVMAISNENHMQNIGGTDQNNSGIEVSTMNSVNNSAVNNVNNNEVNNMNNSALNNVDSFAMNHINNPVLGHEHNLIVIPSHIRSNSTSNDMELFTIRSKPVLSNLRQQPNVKDNISGNNLLNNRIHSASKPGSTNKMKVLHHPYFKAKKEATIVTQLEKQNLLLEKIAGNVDTIEKSVQSFSRSTELIYKKNGLLESVALNMERLAKSFEVVSMALNKMAEK